MGTLAYALCQFNPKMNITGCDLEPAVSLDHDFRPSVENTVLSKYFVIIIYSAIAPCLMFYFQHIHIFAHLLLCLLQITQLELE